MEQGGPFWTAELSWGSIEPREWTLAMPLLTLWTQSVSGRNECCVIFVVNDIFNLSTDAGLSQKNSLQAVRKHLAGKEVSRQGGGRQTSQWQAHYCFLASLCWSGPKWSDPGPGLAEVSAAHVQGLENNERHFKDRRVLGTGRRLRKGYSVVDCMICISFCVLICFHML